MLELGRQAKGRLKRLLEQEKARIVVETLKFSNFDQL
jgi:hypothetical protein